MKLRVHPEADDEVKAAVRYLNAQRQNAGDRFSRSINSNFNEFSTTPVRCRNSKQHRRGWTFAAH